MRVTGSVLLGIILGIFGLMLLFADLATGESLGSRLVIVVTFFLLSGFVIGYFNPGAWLLAGVVAWGGVLLGYTSLLEKPIPSIGVIVFVVASLGPAVLGGYLGGLVGRKHLVGRFFRFVFHR